jgi:dCMP deaminase
MKCPICKINYEDVIKHIYDDYKIKIKDNIEFQQFKHLVHNDEKVLCKWLQWKYLILNGLDISLATKLCKERTLLLFRHWFKELKDENTTNTDILNFLIDRYQLTFEAATKLIAGLNLKSFISINEFRIRFSKIYHNKNNSINYFITRGYSTEDAKKALHDFMDTSKSVDEKRKDPIYDNWYKETRKPGAIASAISRKKQSKFEIDLIETLKLLNYNSKQYITPVFSEFRKLYNHDLYIENHIIEYNGIYWHNDFTSFDKFTEQQYIEEIKKAKFCIDYKRNNRPSYILIWENDFENAVDAANFIIKCILKKQYGTFYSSRSIDLEYYSKLLLIEKKQEKTDQQFLKIALEFSKYSKCVSKKVCALIVKDNRIISTGLNGTLLGFRNCNEIFDPNKFDREEHHKWSLFNEMHAETNAILAAAKNGIKVDQATIYCTLQPCDKCLSSILASGISRIIYHKEYDKAKYCFQVSELKNMNIEFKQIENIEEEL